MTWNCQSCTFINNASLDRCEMCNAHRPRHVVTNKVVVDLTTEREDIKEQQHQRRRQQQKPTMASMDSARKRKRRLKEQSRNSTTSNISSSISSIHVQEERSVNDEIQTLPSTSDSNDSTTQTNRHLPLDRTDNSHNASVSNSDCNIQREKKQKKHVVNNNFHDNLPSSPASSSSSSSLPSSSFSSKGNTVANATKNKIRKSTVQSTLFGSIVTKIKETNPEKLSSKPMKKKSSNIIQIDDEEDDNEENYDNHATNKSMFDISRKSSSSSSSSSITNFTSSSSSSQLHIPYEQLYQKAIHAMQNIFQIHSLRNLQPKAIESVLQSKSQIIVMATGGGKSLCYQLPAVVLSGVTIVVSPLIALMIDQVHALREKGIEAVNISSANGMKENTIIMQRLLNINNGSDNLKQSQGQGQGQGLDGFDHNEIERKIMMEYFGRQCRCQADCVPYKEALLYCHCSATIENLDRAFIFRDAVLNKLLDIEAKFYNLQEQKHNEKRLIHNTKNIMSNDITTGRTTYFHSDSFYHRETDSYFFKFQYSTIAQDVSLLSIAKELVAKTSHPETNLHRLFTKTFQRLRNDGIVNLIDLNEDTYMLLSKDHVLIPVMNNIMMSEEQYKYSESIRLESLNRGRSSCTRTNVTSYHRPVTIPSFCSSIPFAKMNLLKRVVALKRRRRDYDIHKL
mmetsp:Transcript_15942/g.19456  ORF Transcript_15942/g.19456 Transcript_15942/m.19456 type:complete len:679 (-) Transcript_15942:53-2089(-)